MAKTNICTQCGKPVFYLADGEGYGPTDKADGHVRTPMVHIGLKGLDSTPDDMISYHFDCMPYNIREMHMLQHGPQIEAAEAGLRGEELLAVQPAYDHHTFDDEGDPEKFEAYKASLVGEE